MFASGSVRILGIDPGLTRCGYGIIEPGHPRARALAAGVIRTDKTVDLPDRLAMLQQEFELLIADFQPRVVVVENVFFQTNVRTAMSVGQASGLALASARRSGIAVVQYTPNQVKQCITGSGSADKAQVQHMIAVLLGLAVAPNPPDAADALALALTHLAHDPSLARPLDQSLATI
jgi:crossover junction endodeoxyribonuclease RuvC